MVSEDSYRVALDATGIPACLCVYKRETAEVVRRLRQGENALQWQDVNCDSGDDPHAEAGRCKTVCHLPERAGRMIYEGHSNGITLPNW